MIDERFTKAIDKLLAKATEDYSAWCERSSGLTDGSAIEDFAEGFEINSGRKYIKIIRNDGNQRSVWGFIVKQDFGKFLAGDILKPAGWAAPATNAARGNIFSEYTVRWTGPLYL